MTGRPAARRRRQSSGAPANERGGGSRNGWGPIRPRPARGPHTRGYRARAVLSARSSGGQGPLAAPAIVPRCPPVEASPAFHRHGAGGSGGLSWRAEPGGRSAFLAGVSGTAQRVGPKPPEARG